MLEEYLWGIETKVGEKHLKIICEIVLCCVCFMVITNNKSVSFRFE